MTIRASSSAEICFGPVSVFVKLYAVASERPGSLSQVHEKCGGKLEQQYFCAEDGAVVPRPAIAKQYKHSDGSGTILTEEEIKSAESDRIGMLEILECVPAGSVPTIAQSKAMLVGPDEQRGIDAYATLVDALEETRTAAIGRLYTRTRDQLVLLERYGDRGLLLRELFYASEMKPIDEVELPLSVRASMLPGAFEMWTRAIEARRKPAFDAAAYADGYPERLLRAAERKRGGDERADTGAPPVNLLLKAARKRIVEGEMGRVAGGEEARATQAKRGRPARAAGPDEAT
jgi:DNA end-binding protein Ku